MHRRALWIAAIAIALTAAELGARGDSHPSLVPWKVVEPGAAREAAPLTLYWIPASRDEVRRSELLSSNALTQYSSQCVAMRIVRLDDRHLLDALDAGDDLPIVVLADASGGVIARSEARVIDVESIVRDELEQRAALAEAMLDEARDKAEDGEVDAAIALYRQVWDQRCLCPRQAKAAHRALKKMEK
jgi:hypothetical protein